MIYQTAHFSIYFGDAADQLYAKEYLAYDAQAPLLARQPFARVCHELNVAELTFCHQTHSTTGYVATSTPQLYPQPFQMEGDYLVTNQRMALGVMTADCLPVIICDVKTGSFGVVHAGWRGMLANVIEQAIMRMEREFGVARADLQIIFGPAARTCCYEVTAEFKEHCASYVWAHELISTRENKLFFDLTQCAIRLLGEYGIQSEAIITQYNECTVCTVRYCSYRRDKERAGRQMTVVAPRVL